MLQRLLTPDEAARAARFRFERDRFAFVARRGILRTLLGRCLAQEAITLPLTANRYGKPALDAGLSGVDLRFNISHSAGLALFAFAVARDVGVDIEAVRPDVDCELVARSVFSESEQRALRSVPAADRRAAFFACWTRKEAYIKARGVGLSMALDQFDVTLQPGEPACLLATRDDPGEAARWSMVSLDAGPDHRAALVAEGHDWQLSCWQWPDT